MLYSLSFPSFSTIPSLTRQAASDLLNKIRQAASFLSEKSAVLKEQLSQAKNYTHLTMNNLAELAVKGYNNPQASLATAALVIVAVKALFSLSLTLFAAAALLSLLVYAWTDELHSLQNTLNASQQKNRELEDSLAIKATLEAENATLHQLAKELQTHLDSLKELEGLSEEEIETRRALQQTLTAQVDSLQAEINRLEPIATALQERVEALTSFQEKMAREHTSFMDALKALSSQPNATLRVKAINSSSAPPPETTPFPDEHKEM